MKKIFTRLVLNILFITTTYSNIQAQCYTIAPVADTNFPVINRMNTPSPWGVTYPLEGLDRRKTIYHLANNTNTLFIHGDFTSIGPNTGTGVMLTKDVSTVLSYKKWRINGPVYTSVPDGEGGFFIGGLFTQIGDSSRNNIAHINSLGIPTNWKVSANDAVKSLVLQNDTLIVGGRFTKINDSTRFAFALVNKQSGIIFQKTIINSFLQSGTEINTFKLADSILFVGTGSNVSNSFGTLFKININRHTILSMPTTYHMQDVFTLETSADNKKLYVGGRAGGGPATSNGFCINIATNALLYRINTGVLNHSGRAAIYHIKVLGATVFAGGLFNTGSVNGNNFSQKGIIAFDTASGQLRNYLTNCDGFVSSIHANENQLYISGEFTSIAGSSKFNFAVFDTISKAAINNTLNISDQITTISFQANQLFAGGYFQSVGCVPRKNFAAVNMQTGEIKSWYPSISPGSSVGDMKAMGDTVLIAGKLLNPSGQGIGVLAAVSATTGTILPGSPTVYLNSADKILIEGQTAYLALNTGGIGQGFIGKLNLSNLSFSALGNNYLGFNIKSMHKKNGSIYCIGDLYGNNIRKGFVAEVNEATGKSIRTTELSLNGQIDWLTTSVLVNNKLFFTGLFSKILGENRSSFAVFDIEQWKLNPIQISLGREGNFTFNDLQLVNGNIYFSGSFDTLNSNLHKYFAVIDTTVGAVFPNKLQVNNDSPFGYTNDDYENYERLNTFLVKDNFVFLGGNFRNINKAMFPSLAKLTLSVANQPVTKPDVIAGSTTIASGSVNNKFYVSTANADYRYAWFYTGDNVTITGNGNDTILFNAGTLATSGILKVTSITECGKSDTTTLNINITAQKPTVNTTNLRITRRSDTTATIRFTPGNGTRRIVIVRAASAITNQPQDGIDYNANSAFGIGSNIGNNSFVVYKGASDSVNLTSLLPETLYYVTAFELNGAGSSTKYMLSNAPLFSFTTFATQPTIQASNITFSNKTVTSITINCTPGNGQKRLVVVQKAAPINKLPVNAVSYSANNSFGAGQVIGDSSFVISSTTTPVTLTNIPQFGIYHVKVFEYNGSDTNTTYLLTNAATAYFYPAAAEPTVQASNIVVSGITTSQATVNVTAGNGTGRTIVVRQANSITDTVKDNTMYNAFTWFGDGTDIGNTTHVIAHKTPTDIRNLMPARTYYVKVFEFNGIDSNSNYLVKNAPEISFTTVSATPNYQASSVSISSITTNSATVTCGIGSGTGRLFVIKANAPITDNPVDGIDYTASDIFGSGGNIGNNTFVIAKNRPAPVSNLLPNTTYHVKVFEFNGSGINTKYMLTGAPSNSFTTQIATATTDLTLQNASLRLHPNPVINNILKLTFKSDKRGRLAISVLSPDGVIVYSNQFVIQNPSTILDVILPATIAKGLYLMKVSFNKEIGVIRFINN